MPNRRFIVVLGSLIGAMTLVSGLLLALEPRPMMPGGVSLQVLDHVSGHLADALQPRAAARDWQSIVIFTTPSGDMTAQSLNELHLQAGLGGLGYHFVVENERGDRDGGVIVGFRWQQQLPGAHGAAMQGPWYNLNDAIGICVVADVDRQSPSAEQMRSVVRLVQQLQQQHSVPRHRVFVRTGEDARQEVGRFFPEADLRRQLLN